MLLKKCSALACGLALGLAATPVLADDDDAHLFGNWGGLRSSLEDKGISVESILTIDGISNVKGGIKRNSVALGNYDLTAAVDTEKAGLWSGGTFFAYFLANFGREPSALIGDLQLTDNIETYSTAKIYELWYDHQLFDGAASVLFGLHDLNSEFNALEYAGTLFHPSFGIQPDISQVGPSIFSTTALALRLRVQPSDHLYGLAAVYDGVPGDPENARGTRIKLSQDDGVFAITEWGFQAREDARYYKAAVGYWHHSTDYEDFAETPRSDNQGVYGIGEYLLLSEAEDSDQGLGVFAQLGFADSNKNIIGHYIGAGFSYTGLIPNRDEDTLTFGMAKAYTSSGYRDAVTEADRSETAFELSYRAPILPYFSVQPDVQYILNPSADPSIKDAVQVGVRLELAM
jgi:porin